MKKSFLKISLGIFVSLLIFGSCKKETEPNQNNNNPETVVTGLLSYEALDTLYANDFNKIIDQDLGNFLADSANPPSKYIPRMARPKNDVALFRVRYQSIIPEQGNRPTIATGLVAIPVVSSKELPVISYQHGTIFEKNQAPSQPENSFETRFMLSQFAAQGYVLIAADYFGLGPVSNELNSYFVKNSTEQACLDMYKASMQLLEKFNLTKTKFFVNGWSQGGYNSMTFLRRLENENIKVDAAFTAAGPVDPLLAITRGLFNPRPIDAIWINAIITNMIISIEKYNGYAGLTEEYVKKDYLDKVIGFHNFSVSEKDFFTKVPTNLDSLFTPQFFDDAKATRGMFWKTLAASEAYKWYSRTPFRSYYGLKDEVVPDYLATLGVEYMKKLGKQDAVAIIAGDSADHRATYLESITDAKSWIDSFK
ncbi:MAG: prolyl oligopeptidase family serine peptidase [Bacteroidia bacterium]|nr:prolyl oligopeptidase family serine peptidase [Bacteroidia bacterium]